MSKHKCVLKEKVVEKISRMEKSGFHCCQVFILFFCQAPHITLVILRYLVQYRKDFLIDGLTYNQYAFLKLSELNENVIYVKISVYVCFYLTCCCCCCCLFKVGFYFVRFLFLVDAILGIILICSMPLDNFGNDHLTSDSTVQSIKVYEIIFLVCLGIMIIIDFLGYILYKEAIKQQLYRHDDYEVLRQPSYNPYARSAPPTRYGSYDPPPPYSNATRTQIIPRQTNMYRTQAPRDLTVAGIEDASIVLSDGEGGIIFVRQIKGAGVAQRGYSGRTQAHGIQHTEVAWISAEAIRRNPRNPEVYVLSQTEISQNQFWCRN